MLENRRPRRLFIRVGLPTLALGLILGGYIRRGYAEASDQVPDATPTPTLVPTPTPTPSPDASHATVKVWDTAVPVTSGGVSVGLTPGESVDDPSGLTKHGTSAPTIVTVYAQSTHPGGPAGLSYWNPDANIFAWYGKTIGYPAGVDLNRGGPVQPATAAVFPGCEGFSFGPGDVWVAGHQNEVLYAHIAGTNCFRVYGTDRNGIIEMPRDQAWGIELDERTGHVWLVTPRSGLVVRLHPPTGDVIIWRVTTNNPAYITVDRAGLPYTTLSIADAILRVNPGPDDVMGTFDDTATYWRVPNVNGVTPSFRKVPEEVIQDENPNGILIADAEDNIWFAESNSHEIGRLSGGPDGILGNADDVICEYTKEGLANPQQLSATGSGSSLQVYFSEGAGNAVSVLTAAEANDAPEPYRRCTTVPAEMLPNDPTNPNDDVFTTKATTTFYDEMVAPLETAITPTLHEVPSDEGGGIRRFSPMPNPAMSADGVPIGDLGNGFPSGLTGVYASRRIAGAYLKGNKHFEFMSGAIVPPPPPPPPPDPDPDPGPTPCTEGPKGKMTGGGRTHAADGTKVTHGFVLRCATCTTTTTSGDDDHDKKRHHDAFQVNWGRNDKFKLEQVLSASCIDDPSIDPGSNNRCDDDEDDNPQFDTHSGRGTGRYNGESGATVEWTSTNAGRSGRNDHVRLLIRDAAGTVVLAVDAVLKDGNHTAHGPRR